LRKSARPWSAALFFFVKTPAIDPMCATSFITICWRLVSTEWEAGNLYLFI
jgi:hypothetical protein